MNDAGSKLISSIIKQGDLTEYLTMSLDISMFLGISDNLFQFVEDHVSTHGAFPNPETVEQHLDIELPTVVEPTSYYLEHFEKRYYQQTLKKGMLDAQAMLKAKNPIEALQSLQSIVVGLTITKNRQQLINYTTDASKLIKDNYKQQWLGDHGISMGWEYMDNSTGGLLAGDVLAFLARPGLGKTYNLLHMAKTAWEEEKTPLIISMEMNPLVLSQRIIAMQSHVPSKYIKTGELPPIFKKTVFDTLDANTDSNKPPFWIVDGNLTASVKDIALLCHQLKPSAVYVDGAYMLKPDEKKYAKHEQIAETIQGLKQRIAGDIATPVVTTYQFNREQTKAKQSGTEHIGGSDAIGQIASIVLGLSGNNDPSDPSYHKHEKEVDVIKGRNGETGSFTINWKFEQPPFMDFSQIHVDKKDNQGYGKEEYGAGGIKNMIEPELKY